MEIRFLKKKKKDTLKTRSFVHRLNCHLTYLEDRWIGTHYSIPSWANRCCVKFRSWRRPFAPHAIGFGIDECDLAIKGYTQPNCTEGVQQNQLKQSSPLFPRNYFFQRPVGVRQSWRQWRHHAWKYVLSEEREHWICFHYQGCTRYYGLRILWFWGALFIPWTHVCNVCFFLNKWQWIVCAKQPDGSTRGVMSLTSSSLRGPALKVSA